MHAPIFKPQCLRIGTYTSTQYTHPQCTLCSCARTLGSSLPCPATPQQTCLLRPHTGANLTKLGGAVRHRRDMRAYHPRRLPNESARERARSIAFMLLSARSAQYGEKSTPFLHVSTQPEVGLLIMFCSGGRASSSGGVPRVAGGYPRNTLQRDCSPKWRLWTSNSWRFHRSVTVSPSRDLFLVTTTATA